MLSMGQEQHIYIYMEPFEQIAQRYEGTIIWETIKDRAYSSKTRDQLRKHWHGSKDPHRQELTYSEPPPPLGKKIVSYLKHKQKDLDLFFFFIITFRSAGHKGQVNRLQLCSSSTLCLTIWAVIGQYV